MPSPTPTLIGVRSEHGLLSLRVSSLGLSVMTRTCSCAQVFEPIIMCIKAPVTVTVTYAVSLRATLTRANIRPLTSAPDLDHPC